MSEKMLQDMNIDLHDSPGVLPNEKDFVEGTGDSYAIYQLKAIPENHTLLFARLSELDQPVRKDSYEMVYTGPLPNKKAQTIRQSWKTCSSVSTCSARKNFMGTA